MEADSAFLEKMTQGMAAASQLALLPYDYNARQLVFQHDKVKLYHYQAKQKNPHAVPLLMVFATVNRPEILDLFPEHSLIGGLLKKGIDVYLLDWGYPDQAETNLAFSHYVTDYLHRCVQFIKESRQLAKINLAGVCQGGVMSLCYAALAQDIKNLILISTPIDFHTDDNVVAKFLKKMDVESLANLHGNVPGAYLTQFFISLRPFELLGQKYIGYVDNINDTKRTETFLRMEKWLNDAPDQAGVAFSQFITQFYRDNKLMNDRITLNGKKIKLSNLTLPILNIVASADEIVPASASLPLKQYVGSQDYTQAIFPSGHIGIYISEKTRLSLPRKIATWLKQR